MATGAEAAVSAAAAVHPDVLAAAERASAGPAPPCRSRQEARLAVRLPQRAAIGGAQLARAKRPVRMRRAPRALDSAVLQAVPAPAADQLAHAVREPVERIAGVVHWIARVDDGLFSLRRRRRFVVCWRWIGLEPTGGYDEREQSGETDRHFTGLRHAVPRGNGEGVLTGALTSAHAAGSCGYSASGGDRQGRQVETSTLTEPSRALATTTSGLASPAMSAIATAAGPRPTG